MTRRATDVVVVGAGIVGASIARRLAERSARVTVVEANRPAGGTTLSTFAWVNAVGKSPQAYFDLNVAGIAEYRSLVEELGDGWRHAGGNLEWSRVAEDLQAKVAAHHAWGYGVEMIGADRARELEPDVAVPDAAAAFYADDIWVDTASLVRRLLDHPGIDLRWPMDVTGLTIDAGRTTGVAVADGQRLSADVTVLAGGPRSAELAGWCGVELPMRDAPGLLVTTEPAPVRLGRILHLPGLAVRPDGGGRLLLANDGIDKQIEPSGGGLGVADAAAELVRRAVAFVPRLAGVGVESSRIGLRALTADGRPAVGPIPGCDGAYLAVMHSGITLGPYIGRLVAGEIATGSPDERLEDYRPGRLTDGAGPA